MSLRAANLHGSASPTADSSTASDSTPAEIPRSVTATTPTADSPPDYGSTPAGRDRPLQAAAESTPAGRDRPLQAAESTPAGRDRPLQDAESTPAGRDRPLQAAESTSDKQTFALPPFSKRIRTLTAKNKELYDQKVKNFELRIKTKWNIVSNHLNRIDGDNRKAVLRDLHSSASHCFDAYDEFLTFLVQTRSEDSLLYHANVTDDLCMCKREVGDAVSYLDDLIQRNEDEQMSQLSRRSSRSVSSAGSQRAHADAARAELQFLEEESVLKKEALEIESIRKKEALEIESIRKKEALEIESIRKKEALYVETRLQRVSLLKQAAMADAMADALGSVNIETIQTERARQYIEEQRRIHLQPQSIQVTNQQGYTADVTSTLRPDASFFTPLVSAASCTPHASMLLSHTSSGPGTCIHPVFDLNYGPNAPPELPTQFTSVSLIPGYGPAATSLPTNQISTGMTAQTNTTPSIFAPIPAVTLAAHSIPAWPQTNDARTLMSLPIATPGLGDPTQGIADYLRWKEMLFKRVYEFNDKAEAYHVWKATFLRTMSEINVNAADHVDLLTKWLGKNSKETARRIRQANPNNPERAMALIWERLDECYGAPELIESSIKSRIADFQLTGSKDAHRLYELLDLLTEVASLMEDIRYTHLLSYYNTSSGVRPIISKLPLNLRNKWTTRAARYQNQYQVAFPPFLELLQFIRETAKIMNNPCFNYDTPSAHVGNERKMLVNTKKTDTHDERPERGHGSNSDIFCPYHNSSNHTLNDCLVFRRKSVDQRRECLRYHNICFRCCEIQPHNFRNCSREVKCAICQSTSHCSALHPDEQRLQRLRQTSVSDGGELQNTSVKVVSECTSVCGDTKFPGKSCAKIILVRFYPKDHIDLAIKAYAVIDDQSNSTLGTPELFDRLRIEGDEIPYVLSSCNGKIQTSGRRAHNLVIESFDSSVALDLPVVTECDVIPDNRNEIPTPDITRHYSHLQNIESTIPPLDDDAQIVLLVGRDLLKAHHVLDQRTGSDSAPYAQKLPLGWTIVGESCLRRCHPSINAFKTNILKCGRPYVLEPCPNDIQIKEKMVPFAENQRTTNIGQDVFAKTPDDEKMSLSRDDRDFLAIMEDSFVRDENGNWIAVTIWILHVK